MDLFGRWKHLPDGKASFAEIKAVHWRASRGAYHALGGEPWLEDLCLSSTVDGSGYRGGAVFEERK